MKMFGLAAFAGCLLVALTANAGDDALKKEKAAFQGVWKIVSFETDQGKKDDLNDATLEFDKDGKNITFTKGGDTKKGTFTLNPAGKPKEIDIITDDNKTIEGVYSLDKDKLKLCLNPGNDGRPTEVALKDGKKYILLTLEKSQ
jgi:uncharacterized protein (TIGR03067 family)